ncbi:hypothetical protein ScPMuIL_006167 [Solemya velum]
MTTFADHFWGKKNNGFFVLYHNMKHGQTSSKEFIDFLRESCTVEENYSKLLGKLAKSASANSNVGTFAPYWNVLKMLADKLASLHMQLVHTWSDLIKDVARYNDDQHKRHKTMKDGEAGTLDVVNAIQQTTTALHKAKEIYHTRCCELDRLKRENASQKDLEKAEVKYKKASDDYRTLVDKYANIRNDFEGKMAVSCRHFQELEEEHICQMKDFIDTYSKAWENQHALLGQVQKEFKNNCDDLSVQKLFEMFISVKNTGNEKPGPIEFVEPNLSALTMRAMSPEPSEKRDSIVEKQRPDSSGSPSPVLTDGPGPLSRSIKLRVSRTWFGSKNRKKEKKRKKKEKDKDDSESMTPEVDEEGYTIRNDDSLENHLDKNSWDSTDSDTDSDSEDRRKIKVEIRPVASHNLNSGGNIEDIKASLEGMRLSPTMVKRRSQTPIEKKMRRSQSESDTLDVNKPSEDLLNLDLFSTSSVSTPTGMGYNLPSPLSPTPQSSVGNSTPNSSVETPIVNSNISDIFSQSSASNSSGTPSSQANQSIGSHSDSPSNSISLPPPLQRPISKGILPQIPSIPSRTSGHNSPVFMSRSESNSSVTFNTTSMPVGSSRGPSPLTIGMIDTIPLAVAFTETINAYFKGTDATQCNVNMVGNLMMSFPAGIVKVFTENPSPAVLSFRIKNCTHLEHVVVNKQLLSEEKSQSTEDKILKYQIKSLPGVESTPLPIVVYWKCDPAHTDFRLDYKYNPTAVSTNATLKNVVVAVNVGGSVSSMQSIPSGIWNEEQNRATWKLNDISEVSEDGSDGCIRANYRISLLKKRFGAGKYLADPDSDVRDNPLF